MAKPSSYSILLKKENAHEDPIYCCCWTTTQVATVTKSFIVTSGLDGLVKVWQLENNKLDLVHTLYGHSMAVISVAVSPDGHTIASASLDSTLIIWDLSSGTKVHEIKVGAVDTWKLAFSPDGTQVATGSHTGKVMIHGVEKGTTDIVLDTRGKFAVTISWSSNGKYIATGSVDGTVCIFDVEQGKLLHTISAHTKIVRSVDFDLKSTKLVTASDDGDVKVYDVESANLNKKTTINSWAMRAVFTTDSKCIALASADGSVSVALLENFKFLHTFQEHTDVVCDVQYNQDSSMLLSVSKDKSIIIYECPPPCNSKKNKSTTTLIKYLFCFISHYLMADGVDVGFFS